MQDPGDEDAVRVRLVKNDVPALLDASVAGMNWFAGSAHLWHPRDLGKAIDKISEVSIGLFATPPVGGIVEDLGQVSFSLG
jgi:hypothetical protein